MSQHHTGTSRACSPQALPAQPQHVRDHLVTGPAGRGEDRLRVELHRPPAGSRVLDGHRHLAGRRGHREPAADLADRRVERVIPGRRELRRQAGQQTRRRRAPGPGPACRAPARPAPTASRPRAPPSPAAPGTPRTRAAAGRRARPAASSQPKSDGRPGPGDSTTRSGASSSSSGGVEAGPQRRHLGGLLPEVVAQGVHERVLVVHERAPAGPGLRPVRRPPRATGRAAAVRDRTGSPAAPAP